jgi:plasmid stabilization system protein ParE
VSAEQVDYFPEARRELEDAFEWYLERSLQAAEAFVRETDRAVSLIAAAPRVWPSFEAGTRRYVVQRFPYNIIYRETTIGIEVVAVAQQMRRPRYWHRRVRR